MSKEEKHIPKEALVPSYIKEIIPTAHTKDLMWIKLGNGVTWFADKEGIWACGGVIRCRYARKCEYYTTNDPCSKDRMPCVKPNEDLLLLLEL